MAAHLGHQSFRLPLHDVASHVRVISYSIEHCTLLEEFRNKKNEYHFKVGAVYVVPFI